jgi:hypothetical protein
MDFELPEERVHVQNSPTISPERNAPSAAQHDRDRNSGGRSVTTGGVLVMRYFLA